MNAILVLLFLVANALIVAGVWALWGVGASMIATGVLIVFYFSRWAR